MNLRQQFIWKILIALSFVIILIYIYNSVSTYSTYGELRNDYQNDIDKVKEETKELKIAIPALGPSFGVPPSGTCIWMSYFSKSFGLIPKFKD